MFGVPRWKRIGPIGIGVALGLAVVPGTGEAGQAPVTLPVPFFDSLHSTTLDPTFWRATSTGGANGVIEPGTDGVHLKLFADNSAPDFSLNLVFLPKITGDFDVSADFRLVAWPTRNGTRVGIGTGAIGSVERVSFTSNQFHIDNLYLTHFASVGEGVAGLVPTSDLQGRLRFTRIGTIYAGYRWTGTSWALIHSFNGSPSADISDLNLAIWSHAVYWNLSRRDVDVIFENFTITKGIVTLPRNETPLLTPAKAGVRLRVTHGYNDPLPSEFCPLPGLGVADHCLHQRYGLDLMPEREEDRDILAPAPGQVVWKDGDCLGLRLDDGHVNLTICHFAAFAPKLHHVARGDLLGTRLSQRHIHLSLDDRYRDGSPGCSPRVKEDASPRGCRPVSFNGPYAIEGQQFDPGGDNDRNGHAGRTIVSNNRRSQQ